MFASRRSTVLCSLLVAWSTFVVRSVRSWTSVVRTFDDRRCRPRRRHHRLSVPLTTTTTTTIKTELRASADESDEDDDDDEVRSAYRFAMEEDREWYEEFVLGKTPTKKVNGETPTKREDEANEDESTKPLVASSSSATTTLGEIDDAAPSDAQDDASFAEQVVDDVYDAYGENLQDDYVDEVDKEVEEEEEKENAPFDGDYYEYDDDDDDVGLDKDDEKDEGATVAHDENEDATSARDGDGVARVALGKAERYVRVDGGTSSRWNDDVLRGLGYSAEECAALSPEVADLLRQDRVRRPEAGVPPEWCDDRFGGVAENEARTDEDDAPSRARRRRRRRDENEDEDVERSPSRPRRRRRDGARSSSDSPSSPSRRSRGTRVADPAPRNRRRSRRDDAEDDPDVGLWPSRADFKRFLRQEARLRLGVLGPEWKDLVKSESVWRLNLYGKWLRLLEEGARNDDADAFVVPNGARGGRARRRPPSGPRRRRRRTDDDDDDDDERAATRRRRRRRPSPTREYASERDE